MVTNKRIEFKRGFSEGWQGKGKERVGCCFSSRGVSWVNDVINLLIYQSMLRIHIFYIGGEPYSLMIIKNNFIPLSFVVKHKSGLPCLCC